MAPEYHAPTTLDQQTIDRIDRIIANLFKSLEKGDAKSPDSASQASNPTNKPSTNTAIAQRIKVEHAANDPTSNSRVNTAIAHSIKVEPDVNNTASNTDVPRVQSNTSSNSPLATSTTNQANYGPLQPTSDLHQHYADIVAAGQDLVVHRNNVRAEMVNLHQMLESAQAERQRIEYKMREQERLLKTAEENMRKWLQRRAAEGH